MADTLCCCEYENSHGEKSHILACCCDCQALDEMVDRCFKCQRIPTSLVDKFIDTIADRCRLPGILGGGASRVNLEVATPLIMIPASLSLATIGPISSVFVLLGLPFFCFFFYRTWLRRTNKSRTKFFYVWGLFSAIFMYTMFELILFPEGKVTLLENVMLTLGIILMFWALKHAKKDPGIIVRPSQNSSTQSQGELHGKESLTQSLGRDVALSSFSESGNIHVPAYQSKNTYEEPKISRNDQAFPLLNIGKMVEQNSWCSTCRLEKLPRTGHCNVCGVCVDQRDHHCVWIDSCIGSQNHRSFLAAMLIFVLSGYYGSYVTLRSCCEFSPLTSWTLDLKMAYNNYWTALSFVSACYTCVVGVIMLVGLFHQFTLISQNVTSQELHQAAVQGRTKCFLYVRNNPNNAGFFRNWQKFLTKSRKGNVFLTV